MILIQDLGIYEYFKRQHALLASIKSGLKKAKEKEEIALEDKLNLIKLKHFTAGLIFLFAAYCTGMVCIIFEILFFRVFKNEKNARQISDVTEVEVFRETQENYFN